MRCDDSILIRPFTSVSCQLSQNSTSDSWLLSRTYNLWFPIKSNTLQPHFMLQQNAIMCQSKFIISAWRKEWCALQVKWQKIHGEQNNTSISDKHIPQNPWCGHYSWSVLGITFKLLRQQFSWHYSCTTHIKNVLLNYLKKRKTFEEVHGASNVSSMFQYICANHFLLWSTFNKSSHTIIQKQM
jgi:hypothetical protein